MRKILFFLCIAGAINSSAQTRSLVGVSTVTPKLGQVANFESAWKAHVAKFHKADTTNRRSIFEITSGPHTGSYYLVSPNMSWADFDIERTTEKAHDLDYASTVTTTLESESGLSIYRWADSLSYRPDVQASKFLLTAYHIKAGKQSDLTDEVKRSIAVNKKINSSTSYDGYIMTLSGSTPQVVIVRHLKEGFKELDPDFIKTPTDQFKNAYIELYGPPAWERRMNLIPTITDLVEVEMMKFRADLSSGQ